MTSVKKQKQTWFYNQVFKKEKYKSFNENHTFIKDGAGCVPVTIKRKFILSDFNVRVTESVYIISMLF